MMGSQNNTKIYQKRQLRILFEAFYLGSGDHHDWRKLFVGVYPKLADDMQEIIQKLGYSSNKRMHGNCILTTVGKDIVTKFSIIEYPIKQVMELGTSYCCTVKGGLVFVRRNGKCCWCGNSGFFHGIEKDSSSDYYMMKPSIWSAVGVIYSKEEAEAELKRTDVDVEQEYLNPYTTGRDSIFGKVTAEYEDRSLEEWN